MNRPYCHSELLDIEKDIYNKYRLSNIVASHIPCLHEYKVKKGGRKEQYIQTVLQTVLDSTKRALLDDQTCSVCFKIRTNVDDTIPVLPAHDEELSREKLDKIDEFYRWLYRHDF
jgi:hypothetical protein